jgi:hypothetical protein
MIRRLQDAERRVDALVAEMMIQHRAFAGKVQHRRRRDLSVPQRFLAAVAVRSQILVLRHRTGRTTQVGPHQPIACVTGGRASGILRKFGPKGAQVVACQTSRSTRRSTFVQHASRSALAFTILCAKANSATIAMSWRGRVENCVNRSCVVHTTLSRPTLRRRREAYGLRTSTT